MKFEMSIQDFGCGISPENLGGLFINFNNLEEHRQSNKSGRGLGLSICKMIVEQMGGSVEVRSKLGHGSTFMVTFKAMCKIPDVSLLQVPEPNIQKQPAKQVQMSENVHEHRVLIANDEPFLLFGYENVLVDHFEVETAQNGYQALQMVSSSPPDYYDAVILDINMPIMDGFEACLLIDQDLRQRNQHMAYKTQIYALTADQMHDTVELIHKYPFVCKFSALSVDNEIEKIKDDIAAAHDTGDKSINKRIKSQEISEVSESL